MAVNIESWAWWDQHNWYWFHFLPERLAADEIWGNLKKGVEL